MSVQILILKSESFVELTVEQQQFISGGQVLPINSQQNFPFSPLSPNNDLLNPMLNNGMGSGGLVETTKSLNSNNTNNGMVLY
ncbi:MAG: hypothetical protein HEQ35_23410 [Gloeotrichia echinulata IR180]|jgi:hypothetical protein|nr:hypothetical protein [Gloeotrichia echinulata DEX184]